MPRLHQNNFATNLTSGTNAGDTTSPLNSIPTIAAPFYIAFDATNINSHYEVLDCTSKTATNVNHSALAYAHTTAEEVRMVVPAVELDTFSAGLFGATADGWQSVSDTWAYASATTITVPSGAALIYQKGDKIKLTQTTVKYFVIASVADTVLTITGGTSYTLISAAITLPAYSHTENPIGFPDYFLYTPTGVSATNVTLAGRFKVSGKTCFTQITAVFGGAITFTTMPSLPITASASLITTSIPAVCPFGVGGYFDNGTAIVPVGLDPVVLASATTVSIYTLASAAPAFISASTPINWANLDQFSVYFNYEI